jgi:RND family efflux transporter MFP subunit
MNRTLLILPLTSILAGLACGRHESTMAPALPTAKVRIVSGSSTADTDWIAATLTATRKATLSTRMAASVKKVHANEGQQVPSGALLVSLADDDLQAGLKAAEASLAASEAHHRRIDALSKIGASTPSELEMAATQLAQAKAALAGIHANLSYTQIRAPFAGVVQSRMVNEGAFVGPGQPLVEMEGQGALELEGSLTEQEAKGLKIGSKVPFEADAKTGFAEITALSSGGDPVSHRGTLRARILGNTSTYRSGTFARLHVPGAGNKPGLSVPQSALVVRGELTGVFVAREGKAELRWLSLGEAQGGTVRVRAGLMPGETIIDQPGSLVDGQPIEVAK